MQILNSEQVEYCYLLRDNSRGKKYCAGISFQERVFVQERLFLADNQSNAVDYCYQQYLAKQGAISYILVAEKAGFTVWREDKSVRVAGRCKPEDIIQELDVESLIAEIESIGDRNLAVENPNYWAEDLKIALKTAINLGQELTPEK
ncbi:MAG: hypothetical protein AAFQ14_12710 [Cyanobacteria bacterium J06621_12]